LHELCRRHANFRPQTSDERMTLTFPDHFFWGTSTAAAQIETASEHNWKGLKAKDGYTFQRTTDHEKRRDEDLENIVQFGSVYRCGVDWARLQTAPFADFEPEVVEEYQVFFEQLNARGVRIMFVLHHFTNPLWFEKNGTWLKESNIAAFVDYAQQCIRHFGPYVFNWNTFNEPNVYAANGFFFGQFPPHKKSYFKANRVLKHLGMAHDIVYELIKTTYPNHPVGISLNTAYFKALHPLGKIPAWFSDWWFLKKAARPFQRLDYWGLSYYAYIPFTPMMVTELDHPGKLKKLGIPHDGMWGYHPEGLGIILRRFHKKYRKPIVITENGICTDDPQVRIQAIRDYVRVCHKAIQDGVDLRGYIHWSAWDNFEWNLGPTYRFGLVRVNIHTLERTMTDAGRFYAGLVRENGMVI